MTEAITANPPESPEQTPEETEKPQSDPWIGQSVGNLLLVEKIGTGGFGSVYRAEHSRLKTSFAVKVLHFQMQSAPRAIERFKREALAIAQLSHPHIVRVSDFGEFATGGSYLVMDYLHGQTLEELLEQGKRFQLPEILDFMRQIFAALDYIHRKGIIHRDLKPANIFVERDSARDAPTVKLFDFGIATLNEDASITHTGVCMGSPLYMSPEQATGETKHADARSDLYSLGIILYELLAGFPPFQGTVRSVMYQQVHQKPPKLQDIRPHLPWSDALEQVLQKALAKDPNDRFSDANSFQHAFQAAIAEQAKLSPEGSLYPSPAAHGELSQSPTSPADFASDDAGSAKRVGPRSKRSAARRSWSILGFFAVLSLITGASFWWISQKLNGSENTPPPALRPISPLSNQSGTHPIPRRQPTLPRPPMRPRITAPAPIRPTPVVSLKITSAPKGAMLWRADKAIGKTPITLQGHPQEDYAFVLKARGFRNKAIKGRFEAQAKKHLHIKMKRRSKRPYRRKKGPFDIDDPI